MGKEKIKVLFVCIGNMCRSQMAEGFVRAMASDFAEPFSAGTNPTGLVSKEAIKVMKEKGIDITYQYSKGLDAISMGEMDYVVTMGCCSLDSLCPVPYVGETVEWDIEDPIGEPIEVFRRVRDDIEKRVKELLESIWKQKKPAI